MRIVKLKNSDLIACYYTIQFIKPKYRQKIFNKVYKSLNWGGAFLLFEKVRGLRDYLGRIRSERKKPKIPEIPTADHIIEEIKLSNKSLPSMCYDAIRNIEKNRMRKRLYDGLKGMNAEDPEYEATCKIIVDDILLQLMQK